MVDSERRPTSRDWRRIIDELSRAGLNNAQLAMKVNLSRSAILRWKMGAEPSYGMGEQILALHAKHCKTQTALSHSLESV